MLLLSFSSAALLRQIINMIALLISGVVTREFVEFASVRTKGENLHVTIVMLAGTPRLQSLH